MAYVLHGARGSGSSIVELALASLGLPVTLRDLDVRGGEHRGAAYRRLNPLGKMPTLVVEGVEGVEDAEILTESVAIVLTLAERHPEGGLLPPPGSRARARALRWMLFAAAELYPVVERMDHPERFAPPDAIDGTRERALSLWRARWEVVEAGLEGPGPFALAEGFSAVDLVLGALSRWDLEPAWRAARLPRVEALADAVRARPALAPVWARHFPGG